MPNRSGAVWENSCLCQALSLTVCAHHKVPQDTAKGLAVILRIPPTPGKSCPTEAPLPLDQGSAPLNSEVAVTASEGDPPLFLGHQTGEHSAGQSPLLQPRGTRETGLFGPSLSLTLGVQVRELHRVAVSGREQEYYYRVNINSTSLLYCYFRSTAANLSFCRSLASHVEPTLCSPRFRLSGHDVQQSFLNYLWKRARFFFFLNLFSITDWEFVKSNKLLEH